jgi:hypothetical protein
MDRVGATWEGIRAQLESERQRTLEEIRAYPTPIPRCDQQFNLLIERRERLFQELARLDDIARSSAFATDGASRLEEFIDSCGCLDEDARLRLKSTLDDGLARPELY